MLKLRVFQGGGAQPQVLALLLAVAVGVLPNAAANPAWLLGVTQRFIQPALSVHSTPHIINLAAVSIPNIQTQPSINCHQVSCLALTFDDGPNPQTTPQVLSELEQAGVPATFFLVGSRIAGNQALLKRMDADGDEIGNHSWTHPDMAKLPSDQLQQQIQLTQDAVVQAGVPAPTVFRPPYGDVSQAMEDTIHLSILLWNEDPKDWAANTPQQVVQAVEASAQPGGIVDMHDIYHVTANALPQILTDLSARGYHFVTVSELLDLLPSSRGLYYGYAH